MTQIRRLSSSYKQSEHQSKDVTKDQGIHSLHGMQLKYDTMHPIFPLHFRKICTYINMYYINTL